MLTHFSLVGITTAEMSKRQNLIPSARIGREIFLTDENVPKETFPSLEENLDISSFEPDYIDSEVLLSAKYDNEDIEDDVFTEPIVERKKRSVSGVQSPEDKSESQQEIKSNWNKETKTDFYKTEKRKPRSKLVFIPRIGKKSYDNENAYADKRVVFIPRIGKKSYDDIGFPEKKKAIFIPRIGKKSYADLYNPDLKRAIFIPRIGRGAAVLPKIVRPNPQYRVSGRVVFIPRIG